MDSMLVLLPPDGVASQISEFRENFTDNDLNSFPAFINVFETFVASKDINRALNRVSRTEATPVTLDFDAISYRQIDEATWSVIYKMTNESAFKNLWNQFIVSSPSSVIQNNPMPEPYLHITNCGYHDIRDLQRLVQEELGCLSFEVDTIAALFFEPELAVVSRKFGQRPIVSRRPAVVEPVAPMRNFVEPVAPKRNFVEPVAPKRNQFQLQSQAENYEVCDDDWLDFGWDTGMVKDYQWNPNLEDFGTRGYYLTKCALKCQTALGSTTISRNTVVLVQSIKNRRAEIMSPQQGWIDFKENLLNPLWKPEMRPGLYKTAYSVKVNKTTIPEGTKVIVNFTAQQQKRVYDPLEGKKVAKNTEKLTSRVHVTVQGTKKMKGFMTIINKKNNLVLKYLNRCFPARKFQDVSLASKNCVVSLRGEIALKPFKPYMPVPAPSEVAESVVSEALSLNTVATSVSGVSSRSSSSVRSQRLRSKTGSKFGESGIYVLTNKNNVHVSQDFSKGLVSDDRFDKKKQEWIEKDAEIRKGQPVSVWKVVGDRAQIVAPFEGWIKFGRDQAVLKSFSVSQGELFQVRARKPTLVLSSNSMNGYIVDKLKKGSKVKVERVEGASALISCPVHGWIDIIASAMTRFEPENVKPKLVLSEVPVSLVEGDKAQAEKNVINFLEKNGIVCSVRKFGKLRKMVHIFVKQPRKVKKFVAVDSSKRANSKRHWDVKKKEQLVDGDFTSINLTFENMEDAHFALKRTLINPWVPTHVMPLKWSSHYKKLIA